MARVRHDDDSRLEFADPLTQRIVGFILLAGGLGLAVYGLFYFAGVSLPLRFAWQAFIAAAMFIFVGAGFALRVESIAFDLDRRGYALRKGFRWRAPTMTGTFDDLEGIGLVRETRRSNHGGRASAMSNVVWVARLNLRTGPTHRRKSIDLDEWEDRKEGLERCERYASTLGIQFVDLTGDEPDVHAPSDADRKKTGPAKLRRTPTRDAAPLDLGRLQIPELPARSFVETLRMPDRVLIRLPSGRKWGTATKSFIIGTGFVGIPAWIFSILFLMGQTPFSTDWQTMALIGLLAALGFFGLLGLLFILMGVGLLIDGLFAITGLTEFEILPTSIRWRKTLFGRGIEVRRRRRDVSIADIRKVQIVKEGDRPAVTLLTDREEFALGSYLTDADQKWLKGLIAELVSKS